MVVSGIRKKPIPDPGVKKVPDPGSGSATLGMAEHIKPKIQQRRLLADLAISHLWRQVKDVQS
jgi:hypothetical protein